MLCVPTKNSSSPRERRFLTALTWAPEIVATPARSTMKAIFLAVVGLHSCVAFAPSQAFAIAPRRQHHVPAAVRINAEAEAPAPAAAAAKPIDPKQAIAELGELTKQIQALWSEGGTWSPEERVERRRDIVTQYVRVFAPAVAFSGVQLGLTFALLALVLLVLSVSGRGYADLAGLLDGVPLIGDAIEKIGPKWGNAAIALAVVEVSAPVLLIPLSLVATPSATTALQARLTAAGLDAEGLNQRIEEVLERTTD